MGDRVQVSVQQTDSYVTQPGHPSWGSAEYQPMNVGAVWVGSKGRYGGRVWWQVELCIRETTIVEPGTLYRLTTMISLLSLTD